MKTIFLIIMITANVYGQGFVYDQSSATNQEGGAGAPIQLDQPMGQSFTPSLSSIDFVQLELGYAGPSNQLGATLFVNLWSGSISNGVLSGSTASIFIPDNAFNLITNFNFSTSVSLTPGTTYYLQPYIQSGDTRLAALNSETFNYSGGTAYFNGAPDPNNADLWFREGIIAVPESPASSLIFFGTGLFIYARYKYKKHSQF